MKTTKTNYSGWKNRQTWNVALWIGNDEPLYREACAFMRRYKGRSPYFDFIQNAGMDGLRTPDGFKWVSRDLAYSELNAMMWELTK